MVCDISLFLFLYNPDDLLAHEAQWLKDGTGLLAQK